MTDQILPIPKTSLEKLLKPISKLSESCVLITSGKDLYTVCTPSDNSLILYAKAELPLSIAENKLNLINIKKFLNGLECLGDDGEFSLVISNNHIKCQVINSNNEICHFKYHLVDDGIIKESTVNIQKIAKLNFDTEFEILPEKVKRIMSAYSFATDATKIYFYSKDQKVYGEIDDKTLQNIDNLSLVISDKIIGKEFENPMPISIEVFKNFIMNKHSIKVRVNNQYNVFVFQTNDDENVAFKYIISALVK